MAHAFITNPGFERALIDELAEPNGGDPAAPGIVVRDLPGTSVPSPLDPVFARQQLPDAREIRATSVRALAERCYETIESVLDSWKGPYALHAITGPEPEPGLGSRVALVGKETLSLLAERRRRTWRRHLAPEALPARFGVDTLLVQLLALDRERLLISAAAPRPLAWGGLDLAPWPAGTAPVTIDRAPPSRAYQKLEEAFAWMATAPAPGSMCVDLGASPGGWTAILRQRGAQVVAVDRAPLAPALARDPKVSAVIGNAFTYDPPRTMDWLVCDVVAEPHRSIGLLERWVTERLCRNLVVTVKFKGRHAYGQLGALPPLFARAAARFARAKQLAHNKNEVTVMLAGIGSR